MQDWVKEYIKRTPGGMSVILDLMFHEECDPTGPTLSSQIGMQDELERVRDILTNPKYKEDQGETAE